jgi:hypothetical protein
VRDVLVCREHFCLSRLLDLLDHSRTGFPADHHLDLLLEECA